MMTSPFIEELVFLDQYFPDANAFFDFIFPILKSHGYVRDSFLAAIKQREQAYPTALPTTPFAVALPHTDIEHILTPFISVCRLTKTTEWNEMANNDNVLNVKFVFLLGFINKNGHMGLLQMLMGCLSDADFLVQLDDVSTSAALVSLLESGIKHQL